ncbi:hypothetical protein N658DRAFT_443705 [Parathielavia hyrcaniae]|uniref:Chromatin assembly factor 1 subunit A dimerization domain-containing protein n=1 Tax=Parathielavia hyrcaniae TaxID=113614 RepID=A0AAN6Q5K4_9PEZI|nr:hypothetical protein N658DRAFT_443705 [Parathielavia hyrcaniae]
MSLLAMSTDLHDRDLAGRKRSHGDFLDQEACGAAAFSNTDHIRTDHSLSDKENDVPCASSRGLSPAAKSSSSLSEPARSSAGGNSLSSSPTPASLAASTAIPQPSTVNATAQKVAGEPPKKRKRATAEEKAARDAAAEAEKRKRQEEREERKRQKEETEKLKAQEKAAKAAKAAAALAEKEQEKKMLAEQREQKKRQKEEEEAKKTGKQMKLTSMFNLRATTPKKETAAPKTNEARLAGSTTKSEPKQTSLYDQLFKPFFVKEHVRVASIPFQQIDEEMRQAKTKILEEYLSGERPQPTSTFRSDPIETLQIPHKVRRGRVYPSVKKIMEALEGFPATAPADLTTESQNAQMRLTLEALKLVPLKSLKFAEDVRPPYIGTISGPPPGGKSLAKLARDPLSKNILPLLYGYDSEAEWQEEEGEDVDDMDDDEEEADPEEDMADFLDDSEDVGPARMVFSGGGIEPESIGPCWEDRTRKMAEPKLYKYRLEFILEPLEHHHSIDPFSTAYWDPPKPKASAANEASAASATTASSHHPPGSTSATQDARANPMAPPPVPSDAFQALGASGPPGAKKAQQPLPADMQEKLKDLVRSMPNLSKVGVIELFAASNPGCSRGQIKTSFDALFEKVGKVFKVKGE